MQLFWFGRKESELNAVAEIDLDVMKDKARNMS